MTIFDVLNLIGGLLPKATADMLKRRKRISKWLNLPNISFHDLRHTFATTSVANGMDITTLSTILGHISSKTTIEIYLHSTDEMKKNAAEKINARFNKDAYGKRMARNIYAPTREECEENLAILIKEMKAEIAEQKAKLKNAQ